MDSDLTADEEAAMLGALLRWRVEAGIDAGGLLRGMDPAHLVLDGCTRNDLTEVDECPQSPLTP